MLKKRRVLVILFSLALLAVGVLTATTHYYRKGCLQDKKQIVQLHAENRMLQKENKRLHYIQDLAVEFRMDPLIVSLVDTYSRQYVNKDKPEWRLLRTPEFATYIMLSLIYAESGGDPSAIGDGGKARGLTQIWVSTAKGYGDVSAEELLNPETNVAYSFKHFQYLLQKYRGNLALTLYSWNRGPGTVDNLLKYGETPDNGYGKKVYEAALMSNGHILPASD